MQNRQHCPRLLSMPTTEPTVPVHRLGLKLFRVLDDTAVEVVGAHLNVGAVVCNAISSLLSDAERGRTARFRFAKHRPATSLLEQGCAKLLGERLGVEPAAVELVETSNGMRLLPFGHCPPSDGS